MAETLIIARQMWRGDTAPFKGRCYQLEHPSATRCPSASPTRRCWRRWRECPLKLIARHAAACNLHIGGPLPDHPTPTRDWYANRVTRISRKIPRLDEFCRERGRGLEEIEVAVLATVKVGEGAMSVGGLIGLCKEMAGLGVDHIIFNMPDAHEIKPIKIIGEEVIPLVADI